MYSTEKLGQLLIMNGAVNGERRKAESRIGRAIAASGENRIDREMDRASGRNIAFEPRGNFRQIDRPRIDKVGVFGDSAGFAMVFP
jgi:hypothetical protein